MSSDSQQCPADDLRDDLERLKTITDPTAASVSSPSPSHLQDFAGIIENVIVPRLLMSHVGATKTMVSGELKPSAVSEFIDLTMQEDPSLASGYVRDLLACGVSFQRILLELMAPAARELGERWVHDASSFIEVTLGVARMHRILREFDGVPKHMWSTAGEGRHALLLPTPGEHHTFGLRLLQEFLLRESWAVTNQSVESLAQLESLLSTHYFDFAGLSLSGETLIDPFLSAIELIRTKSRNRHIKIIIGGQYFAGRPDLINKSGADAYGIDAPSSVAILNQWAASPVLQS